MKYIGVNESINLHSLEEESFKTVLRDTKVGFKKWTDVFVA